MDTTLFQYCQKIVLFSQDGSAVLLARRRGEADYDGVFSFIGGKLESTDGGLVNGLRREKNEEIGSAAKIAVVTTSALMNILSKLMDRPWCCRTIMPGLLAIKLRLEHKR